MRKLKNLTQEELTEISKIYKNNNRHVPDALPPTIDDMEFNYFIRLKADVRVIAYLKTIGIDVGEELEK